MDDLRVNQDPVWLPLLLGVLQTDFLIRKRALTGKINPTSINKNRTVLTKAIRERWSPCHADATESLKSLKERASMCVTNGNIIMGNAHTHTMTAIMTQATRFPATSHVQRVHDIRIRIEV
jgi:hypothetical protein